jgi:hypothetical protein
MRRNVVLITYFSGRELLLNALNSVDRQTVLPDEVFVLNDGCEALQLPHFKNISPNIISYGSNLGQFGIIERFMISHPICKVFFLDYDDLWLPDHIKTHTEIDSVWVSSGAYISTNGFMRKARMFNGYDRNLISRINVVGSVSRVSIDSEVLLAGLPVPKDLATGKDWYLWWVIMQKGYSCKHCSNVTVIYFEHAKSITSDRVKLITGRKKLFELFGLNSKDLPELGRWNRQLLALLTMRKIVKFSDLHLLFPINGGGWLRLARNVLFMMMPMRLMRVFWKMKFHNSVNLNN